MTDYRGIKHSIEPEAVVVGELRTRIGVSQSISSIALQGMAGDTKALLNRLLFEQVGGFLSNLFKESVTEKQEEFELRRELRLHVMTQQTYDILFQMAYDKGYMDGCMQELPER